MLPSTFYVVSTVIAYPVSFNITGKDTLQSSYGHHRFASSKAVDGCKNPQMEDGCCTHTDGPQGAGWWTVDLGETVILNSVKIINRNSNRKYVYCLISFVIVSNTVMETHPLDHTLNMKNRNGNENINHVKYQ